MVDLRALRLAWDQNSSENGCAGHPLLDDEGTWPLSCTADCTVVTRTVLASGGRRLQVSFVGAFVAGSRFVRMIF